MKRQRDHQAAVEAGDVQSCLDGDIDLLVGSGGPLGDGGTVARRKARGRTFRRLLPIVIVPEVIIAFSSPAWACTGYQWSGKVSADTWLGVEGDISVDSESVPDDTDYHILNYVDMSSETGNCWSQGSCWIQTGNSIGFTGIVPWRYLCQSSGIEAYAEVDDVNSYLCNGISPVQIPLIQNDYWTSYYTGDCNGAGDGLTDSDVYNGTGWYLTGQAWLPGCAASTVYAQSEVDEFNGQTSCPTLSPYEYFGTNGSGTTSAGTVLEQYNGTWSDWTTSLQQGPYAPLELSPNPLSGYDGFKTWSS